ncbi:MAG: hypothetical protein M1569_02075, partial [Candidatus Marsarchaeota archaeon]|nr:hypothetical protein [Candidatus Marsarchaeota archaeon]
WSANTVSGACAAPAGLGTSNSLTETFGASDEGCTFTFNAIVTDSATSPVSVNAISGYITVVGQLIPPSLLYPLNAIKIDAGETFGATATAASGGVPPYRYQIVGHQYSGTCSAPSFFTTAFSTSNSLTYTPDNAFAGCTYIFAVNAFDSASDVANSVFSNTVTIYPQPAISMTYTPSDIVTYGTNTVANVVISGGSGDFTRSWLLNGGNAYNATIAANTESSNSLDMPAAGDYLYNISAVDVGVDAYSVPSSNTELTVNKAATNATCSGVYCGGSILDSGTTTLTFTGSPTLYNQSPWYLYVDGTLYGSTASTISWTYSSGGSEYKYSFDFVNNGNGNYLPYTLSTSLNVYSAGGCITCTIATSTPVNTAPTTTANTAPTTTVQATTTVQQQTITPATGTTTSGIVVSATSGITVGTISAACLEIYNLTSGSHAYLVVNQRSIRIGVRNVSASRVFLSLNNESYNLTIANTDLYSEYAPLEFNLTLLGASGGRAYVSLCAFQNQTSVVTQQVQIVGKALTGLLSAAVSHGVWPIPLLLLLLLILLYILYRKAKRRGKDQKIKRRIGAENARNEAHSRTLPPGDTNGKSDI